MSPRHLRPVLMGLCLAAVCLCARPASAQNLTFSFFERYVDALRQQAGIPGLAAQVMQDGQIEWERGFGFRTVEGNLPVRADTPFPVAGLTQTVTSTLLLQCVERGQLALTDPLRRWVPAADPALTLGDVLSHTQPGGVFKQDLAGFTQLTPVVEACFNRSFAPTVAAEVLDRLSMRRSVPGMDVTVPGSEVRLGFDGTALARYGSVVSELASPYRVERSGRLTRGATVLDGMNASTGLVASAHDVGLFTEGLFDGTLLTEPARTLGWTPRGTVAGRASPGGLGWFVQSDRGEPVVWQFGTISEAYSSLVVLVPRRRLSFVLLANSDGLSAPFALAAGDVTVSPFAALFLATVLP